MKWQALFWVGVAAFVIYTRGPQIQHAFQMQGRAPVPAARLLNLEGKNAQVSRNEKRLLIFWATWCGPCRPEMARIDRLVKNGDLPRERVYAIATDDNLEAVKNSQKNRDYNLPIYWDPQGEWARTYEVQGTPTVVLIDRDDRIHWMTMGVSPSLELRLAAFFRE